MRSEIVKKILDETPQAVTDKVREYANNLVTKRPMEIEQKERERIEAESKDVFKDELNFDASDLPTVKFHIFKKIESWENGKEHEHLHLQREVIQPKDKRILELEAENKALREAADVLSELAKWSRKYPRGRIYGMSQMSMDEELIQIEERAKKCIDQLLKNEG